MPNRSKKIIFNRIGPLRPFLFSYDDVEGHRASIVLYGTDYESIWRENISQLPVMLYDGEVTGAYDV